jgi:hypothetical protein
MKAYILYIYIYIYEGLILYYWRGTECGVFYTSSLRPPTLVA